MDTFREILPRTFRDGVEPRILEFTDTVTLLSQPYFDPIKNKEGFIRFSLDIDTVEHTYLMVETMHGDYRLGEVPNNCDLMLPTWERKNK